MPAKRPRIGDIVEIPVDAQLAYCQYTHKHSRYGALIRVFDGIYDRRPEDIPALAEGIVAFSTFFPLGSACNRDIVQVVENVSIANANAEFPTFKARAVWPNKVFGPWYLWDGEREWRKDKLSKSELAFPNRGIVNDTMLVNWIRQGHSNLDYPN